jgi:hypothetical protein
LQAMAGRDMAEARRMQLLATQAILKRAQQVADSEASQPGDGKRSGLPARAWLLRRDVRGPRPLIGSDQVIHRQLDLPGRLIGPLPVQE